MKNKSIYDMEKEFEREKVLALEEIMPWVESLSDEEKNETHVICADRTFTPLQIIREIEESTEYGKLFVRSLTRQRIERARIEEEE